MSIELVCLTLIAPKSLRGDAAGHGPDVRLQTAAELVKGHADEVLLRTVLGAQHATQLLERIKTAFAGSRLVYWITPVTEFGVIEDRAP